MALITTIEELKEYLRIPSTNISNKMPSINTAEEKYLLPILGEALYNRLTEAYTNEAITPSLQVLLNKSRSVVAPMAFLIDLPFLQTNLSDQGIIAMENQTSRKAFKWEYNEAKEALANNGYAAMEMLIVYLKEHKIDFPEWESSPYNDIEQTFIIRDGSDLRLAITIDQPHRCFLMIKPLLQSIVELQIIPCVSEVFFEHFNERIIDGDLTAEEKRLAKLLQQSLARMAMSQAGLEMSVKFSGSGFTIVDQLKDQPEDGRKDAGDNRLARWTQEMKRTADAYLTEVKNYLIKYQDNAAFVLFKNSDANPKEGPLRGTDNGKRNGIFVAS